MMMMMMIVAMMVHDLSLESSNPDQRTRNVKVDHTKKGEIILNNEDSTLGDCGHRGVQGSTQH
jgi:hypothetical protein